MLQASSDNSTIITNVKEAMDNVYSWPQQPDEQDKNAHRLLRKLRLALLFWLLSFIVTVIWFTNSPAF